MRQYLILIIALMIFSCKEENSSKVGANKNDSKVRCIDVDGNEYRTVEIDGKYWMAEDLRVSRFNNGDTIPKLSSYKINGPDSISAMTISEENNNIGNCRYNYLAVEDNRGLAPKGWRIPTQKEYLDLQKYNKLNFNSSDCYECYNCYWAINDGRKLKFWNAPNFCKIEGRFTYRLNKDMAYKSKMYMVRCVKNSIIKSHN